MIVSSTLKHCLRLKSPQAGHAHYLCSDCDSENKYGALKAVSLVSMTQKHRLDLVTLLGPGRNTGIKGTWKRPQRNDFSVTVWNTVLYFHTCVCVYVFNTHVRRACSHPGTVPNTKYAMMLSKDPQKPCFHKAYVIYWKGRW